jgi:thioredoxin 1
MGEEVVELSESSFEDFIKDGLVFVDFYADWCMPCMMMVPIIEDVAKKFSGKIRFGKVDVSENNALASKFGVSSIPNMTLLKEGKVVDQFIGSLSEEDLSEALAKYL